jgi:AraC-like DNA-binding protein
VTDLPTSRHCFSLRLVRPFLTLLRGSPGFPVEILAPLDAMDPDERLPIATMLELLRGALELTHDPDLGLRAARMIEAGDYGALEYAASSASTVRAAFEIIVRYMGLVNDALEPHLEIAGERALLHMDSAILLPRAAADFQMAAFYVAVERSKTLVERPRTEIWFTHAAPDDTREYAVTFPGERVRFSMPSTAFVVPTSMLELPLLGANPKLHDLIRKHAELMLAELPKAHSFTQSVRELITKELAGGDPSAMRVAKKLHMSSRTLARRLEEEGTTFKELVDDLRKGLALRYVGGHDLDISEVALLLGFSESSAFHRAFKRWTGETPLGYRKHRRG